MLTFPKPAALHGDALADELAAAGFPDAGVSVDRDELVIEGPDEADRDAVQAVIDAHVPPAPGPDPDDEFRKAVTDAVANEPAGSPLRKLADALLGTSGPGAEPRRGQA